MPRKEKGKEKEIHAPSPSKRANVEGGGKTSKEVAEKKIKKEGVDTKHIVHGKRERKTVERIEVSIPASRRSKTSSFQRLLNEEQKALVEEEGMGSGADALQRAIQKHLSKTEARKRKTERSRQIRMSVYQRMDTDPIQKLVKNIQEQRRSIDGLKGSVGKVISHYPLCSAVAESLAHLRSVYGEKTYTDFAGSFVELVKLLKHKLGSAPIASFLALERWEEQGIGAKVEADAKEYAELKPKLVRSYIELKEKLADTMDKIQVDKSTTEGFMNSKDAEKVALTTRKLQIDGMVEHEARVLNESGTHITKEQIEQEKFNRLHHEIPNYEELIQRFENEIEEYEEALSVYRERLEKMNDVKEKYLSEEKAELQRDGTIDKYYLAIRDIKEYVENELEFFFELPVGQHGEGKYNFHVALDMVRRVPEMVKEVLKCRNTYKTGIEAVKGKGWAQGDVDMEIDKMAGNEADDLLAMFGKLGFMMGGGKKKRSKPKK